MSETLGHEFTPGQVTTGVQPNAQGVLTPVQRPSFMSAFLQNLGPALGAGLATNVKTGAAGAFGGALQGVQENQRYQQQFGAQQQAAQQKAQVDASENANRNSEMQRRDVQNYKDLNPPAAKTNYEPRQLTGPDGKPMLSNYEPSTGKYFDQSGQPIQNPAPYEKPDKTPAENDFEKFYAEYLTDNKLQGGAVNRLKAHQLWMTNPTTGANQADTRLDKSYEFNAKQLTDIQKPIATYGERLGRLGDAIAQRTPEADALIPPELVTIMAGGQGTGIRVNEPEISRVVGGRSNWESLKAAVNKWQTDPRKALSITDSQRSQVKALFDLVQSKAQQKQQVIDDANQSLVEATNVKSHRQIVADTKKKLMQIDSGTYQQPGIKLPPGFSLEGGANAQ